jgi:cytochrome c oxidase cbb3-type subunit 1
VPVLAVAAIAWQTICGSTRCEPKGVSENSFGRGAASSLRLEKSAHRAGTTAHGAPKSGPFCFIRFGLLSFVLSSLMLIAMACPRISRVTEFTWFGPAQTQLQLYGFFALTMFGAIYHLLPRVVGFEWPFPKLARLQFWLSMPGVVLLVLPLAIGGVEQGTKLNHSDIAFMDATKAMLPFLRTSTIGLLLILLGNSLFALNIFAMTFVWEKSLIKKVFAVVTAPLERSEVKA